jgi:hypothetical protein
MLLGWGEELKPDCVETISIWSESSAMMMTTVVDVAKTFLFSFRSVSHKLFIWMDVR